MKPKTQNPAFRRPSVRAELATAFRRVAAEFHRLPPEIRDGIDLDWSDADSLMEKKLLDGDRSTALAAIRDWENSYMDLFERFTATEHGGARPDPRAAPNEPALTR